MRFFTIISIMIHLGKNPKKGGSPPKESRVINIAILKIILFFFK